MLYYYKDITKCPLMYTIVYIQGKHSLLYNEIRLIRNRSLLYNRTLLSAL